MKAIETAYAGHRFRSRLEARWAVFFDEIGVQWKYESEGFADKDIAYLPDFYLPKSSTWVEVKGGDDALRADWARIEAFVAGKFIDDDAESELVLLGDIPYFPLYHSPRASGWPATSRSEGNLVLHPCLSRDSESGDVVIDVGTFVPEDGFWRQSLRNAYVLNLCFDESLPDSGPPRLDAGCLRGLRSFPKVTDGYAAARSARFEHGETGRGRWR